MVENMTGSRENETVDSENEVKINMVEKQNVERDKWERKENCDKVGKKKKLMTCKTSEKNSEKLPK